MHRKLFTFVVCADQLLSVINDILDAASLNTHKLAIERVPFSFRSCLRESVEVISFGLESKNMELIYDIEDDVPDTVIGDPSKLRQVLVHLLSNAIKFSQQGDIILRASATDVNSEETEIQISVHDSGIGISDCLKQ